MKKNIYIQEYCIRGGQDEESGKETKCGKITVKGDNPEQELWDMVLGEISAGYEQRLFVNDDYYDIVGSDEAVAELRKDGMEAFKKEHGIEKITSMGYYNDEWSGYMSDQTDYRIQEFKPRKKPEPTEAVKKLLEQVNKITDDGIKELRHYTETLEDSSDTANCFAKVYDAVKNFANRFGAVVDPEPVKYFTICGFHDRVFDDTDPILSNASYDTPQEAYPAVVEIVNDIIKENHLENEQPLITVDDCCDTGFHFSVTNHNVNVVIQEHIHK